MGKNLKIITIFTFIAIQSQIALSQTTIDNNIPFLSKAQDRIYFISDNVLGGENAQLDILYLENGNKSKDTFSFKFFDYRKNKTLLYKFTIKLFEQDSLLLKPISRAAKEFYNFRNEIWFYKQNYFFDNSISFKKLYYHSGIDSNQNSNVTELTIDSSKTVKLLLRSILDSASKKYSGKLTNAGYTQLIQILKVDNLKTLTWPIEKFPSPSMDPRRLILYFNNQRKELTSIDQTPYIVMNLLLFFDQIQNFSELKETTEKLEFSK